MSNGGRPPNGRTNLVNLGGHGGQNVKKEDALPTGGHVASLQIDNFRRKLHIFDFFYTFL